MKIVIFEVVATGVAQLCNVTRNGWPANRRLNLHCPYTQQNKKTRQTRVLLASLELKFGNDSDGSGDKKAGVMGNVKLKCKCDCEITAQSPRPLSH